jgi:hypothetical protein
VIIRRFAELELLNDGLSLEAYGFENSAKSPNSLRKEGFEMAANGMLRLDLRIPQGHPIFDYPPRLRARVAREWLDLGARLSGIEQELRKVKKHLSKNEPARKAEHEAAPCQTGPGNSVNIDDFL